MSALSKKTYLKYIITKLPLLLSFLCLPLISLSQEGTVIDKIVAKVDDYVILKSEVERAYLDYLSRGNIRSGDMKCRIFQNMVIDKLMVAKAEIDSVVVSEEEVQANLDRRFQVMVAQIGSEEEIEKYYGKTIQEFKEELEETVREQLVVQRMESTITKDLKVSPAEVKRFIKKIPKDSLPFYSKEVEVAEIVKFPDISKEQKEKVKRRLSDIRDKIMEEESFEAMARKHSEDPGSASRGGNYGFKKRGQFVPEYEAVVFKLKPGEISQPVESEFGFHLIQLIERRGNEYNSRHILLTTSPSEADIERAKEELDSLRTLIINDSISFEKAASEYSDNIGTAGSGGFFLGADGSSRVPVDEIDPVIFFTIDTMKVGNITKPMAYRTEEGKDAVRILYYKDFKKPHVANLKDDYQKIYAATLAEKRSRILSGWFEEAREDIFIDIDEEYSHCQMLK